jgi:hypothetical protein
MEIAIRQWGSASQTQSGHNALRCPQCHEETLVMDRRHVSPPRLGASIVTEYYDCLFCDARYQYSPADNRWKPVYVLS